MAYNFASDGTNFTTNDYLSAAIQGYTPTIQTVANLYHNEKYRYSSI
jgi:hypothetical protein